MQSMLRGLGLTFLLLASVGPASAMDPSAMEDTNCLAACDANSEHCLSTGPAAARHSAGPYSPRETRLSQSLRGAAKFPQTDQGRSAASKAPLR